MNSVVSPLHTKALWLLLLANFFWGLSFPLVKGLIFAQQQILPDSSNWFITACSIAPRFLIATVVLGFFLGRSLGDIRRLELKQGLLLGFAVSAGLLFQMDGLQFTSASTSAFLTQMYAILIPVWLALRLRVWPTPLIWACCALVLVGAGILAQVDLRSFHLGRGEIETLICSVFFMMQIFLLEDKGYQGNRALPVTFVMFTTLAVVFTVMMFGTADKPADVFVPWTSGVWLGCTLVLTLVCTLFAFTLMVKWQPHLTATEAGLLYCVEPLFTAVMALFLPGLISVWGGINYPNERATIALLVGGGLITLANVLLQFRRGLKLA